MKPAKAIPLFILTLWIQTGFTLAESRSFRGITEPFHDATISATVSGRIASIKRKEGRLVKKGDVILEFEKEEQELEVARRKLIAESKVELNSAKQQVDTLKRNYTATKQLFEATQSVSEEELWKTELEYNLAIAEYERLRVSEEREELEYKIAQARLKERIITSPFDGIVTEINLEVGEGANAEDPLVRVVDIRKCRFVTYVEATSAPRLASGTQVSLKIEGAQSAITRRGVIEFVSPVVDPSSGLRKIKVLFDNPNGKIQPGMTGTMVLEKVQ